MPLGQPETRQLREAITREKATHDDLLAALEGCLGYFEWMAAQGYEYLTSGAAYAPDAKWLQPIKDAIAKARGGAG